MGEYWVYIMSNPTRTTVYIGVTSDLEKRVYEHRHKSMPGFTSKYNCTDLIYFESTSSINDAIAREKQLKNWSRAKKDALIKEMNPSLADLSAEF